MEYGEVLFCKYIFSLFLYLIAINSATIYLQAWRRSPHAAKVMFGWMRFSQVLAHFLCGRKRSCLLANHGSHNKRTALQKVKVVNKYLCHHSKRICFVIICLSTFTYQLTKTTLFEVIKNTTTYDRYWRRSHNKGIETIRKISSQKVLRAF